MVQNMELLGKEIITCVSIWSWFHGQEAPNEPAFMKEMIRSLNAKLAIERTLAGSATLNYRMWCENYLSVPRMSSSDPNQ